MPRSRLIIALIFSVPCVWLSSIVAELDASPGTVKYDSRAYKEMMNGPVENQPTAYHWQQGPGLHFRQAIEIHTLERLLPKSSRIANERSTH